MSGALTGAEGVQSATFQGFALSPQQRRLWALREAGGLGVCGATSAAAETTWRMAEQASGKSSRAVMGPASRMGMNRS